MVEWAIIPHLKQESLGYMLMKRNWKIFHLVGIFKHIFELCWGQAAGLNLMSCHKAIIHSTHGYHTVIERGIVEV